MGDVDHEKVERKLKEDRAKRRPDFDRAHEYEYDHYTDALDEIKQLKRERKHDEVEDLLLWCIDFAEAEQRKKDEVDGLGYVPSAYHRHLAIVYRKEDRYEDEVAILKRYESVQHELGIGGDTKLSDRLERARELAE